MLQIILSLLFVTVVGLIAVKFSAASTVRLVALVVSLIVLGVGSLI